MSYQVLIADIFAKEGANTPFHSLDPLCGFTKGHRRSSVKTLLEHAKTKAGIISVSPKKAKQLLDLNKKDVELVTSLLTGHWPLRY